MAGRALEDFGGVGKAPSAPTARLDLGRASPEDAGRHTGPGNGVASVILRRVYDAPHLARNPANFAALTPHVSGARGRDLSGQAGGDPRRRGASPTASSTNAAGSFADALRRRGIKPGDTVAVLAPNVPALLEAHYAVPMAGAVLNALELSARCALDRVHPRPRQRQALDRRPRIRPAGP